LQKWFTGLSADNVAVVFERSFITGKSMNQRHTLCLPFGDHLFNYRVAGVAIRNKHVLVCREDDKGFTLLPGGRVELGEPSDVALRREVREELRCEGELGGLLFSVENFFDLEGDRFHEMAKYYELALPADFPFKTDGPCMVTHDEGHILTFDWVPVEAEALWRVNLLPLWLRTRFGDLPTQAEHLVMDER
jgi:8-oxo-dGTP pyrophosphatase MutT (NUDIX family)